MRGGTFKLEDYKGLKRTAAQVIDKLPEIVMPNGVRLPRLITRVDMGVIQDGEQNPWVNEIEFVPSLYCEDVAEKAFIKYCTEIGTAMVNITSVYKRGAARSKGKRRTSNTAAGKRRNSMKSARSSKVIHESR